MLALLAELVGAALIIGSTSYVGWTVAARYARRPRELRDLQTALAVLQTEVEYGATPLPRALAAAAGAGGPTVGPIFTAAAEALETGGGITAGEALRRSLQEAAGRTFLRQEDLEVLLALASVLGSSGRADQVRHLRLARERLAGEEERAREERARYERMARYLGVLTGAAVVLILL